jgi:hypothetical protein
MPFSRRFRRMENQYFLDGGRKKLFCPGMVILEQKYHPGALPFHCFCRIILSCLVQKSKEGNVYFRAGYCLLLFTHIYPFFPICSYNFFHSVFCLSFFRFFLFIRRLLLAIYTFEVTLRYVIFLTFYFHIFSLQIDNHLFFFVLASNGFASIFFFVTKSRPSLS